MSTIRHHGGPDNVDPSIHFPGPLIGKNGWVQTVPCLEVQHHYSVPLVGHTNAHHVCGIQEHIQLVHVAVDAVVEDLVTTIFVGSGGK